MLLFILLRKLSAYSEDDIILGVFTSTENAQSAKLTYITSVRKNGDPHKDQGYMDVDLDDDIYVLDPQEIDEKCFQISEEWKVSECRCKCKNKKACGHKCCISYYNTKNGEPTNVIVATHHMEGFGQVCMCDIKIFAEHSHMLLYIKSKCKEEKWPNYWKQDTLIINKLRYENNAKHIR